MKKRRLVYLLALMLLFCGTVQAAGIKKFPGETATVSWTFPTADESKISGFRLFAASTSAGPYTLTGTTTLPTARQMIFPVAFSTNSVLVFYQVKAFYTAGGVTVESDPDPAAGAEVDMNVPMPLGTQVK